jgi:hypothetical protein
MNVSITNGWGIVRTIADLALKQPEGKYVLVKDPNNVSTVPPHRILWSTRACFADFVLLSFLFISTAYDPPLLCARERVRRRGSYRRRPR